MKALRALLHRDYRLYFAGQSLSLIGKAMQQVAMAWLVYRLTGSTAMLGLVVFLSQIPVFVVAPFAGLLSDRVDRRGLLILSTSASALHAASLAGLVLSGRITTDLLISMSVVLGLINAVDQPVRQSFVAELVTSRDDLANALALNSFTIHSARFIGPPIGGLLVAGSGEGVCFLINAVSFLAVIGALMAMRTRSVLSPSRGTPLRALQDGFRYVAEHRDIRSLLVVVATLALFSSPNETLLPYFAREVYSGDARTLGFLATASGVGACLGTVFLALRRTAGAIQRSIPIAMITVSVSLALFASANVFIVALVALALLGFAAINAVAAANIVIQHQVDDAMRGRVMGIYSMTFFGVTPTGALIVGYAARHVGARETLFTCAAIIMAVAIASIWERGPAPRPPGAA